jgi:hypothetical protein
MDDIHILRTEHICFSGFFAVAYMRVVQMKPVRGGCWGIWSVAGDDVAVRLTYQQSTMNCATERAC